MEIVAAGTRCSRDEYRQALNATKSTYIVELATADESLE